MKISVIFPCFDKAQYFRAALESWFRHENLPNEILIVENLTDAITPERRMLPIIEDYPWPAGVDVRYFQKDTKLRSIYPDKERALGKSFVQYGSLISRREIAKAWEAGGTLVNNGCQSKNFGVKQAKGDVVILTDPENVQEVDVIETTRRCLKDNNVLYVGEVYHSEPGSGKRGKLWFKNKPYCYNLIIKKDNFLRVGGFDEIFLSQWGWEDEAFALALKRHDIKIAYPPQMVVQHQNHDGKVYIDHNKAAREAYRDIPPGPWVANEGRGWMDWGNGDGWQEIPINLKRSS